VPSSTFLNLPAEKQEKLLEAATREFSHRPFNEASINQIIKEAGIPRGSFYMYFQDKEDLFRYLLKGYVDQLFMLLEEFLLRNGGDIFQALLDLYDYVQAKIDNQHLGEIGAMTGIIRCNSGMQKNGLLEMLDAETLLQRLGGAVNPDLLDLRQDRDLGDILGTLLVVAAPMIFTRPPARGGWFEAPAVSADDRRRGEMYRQNLQRAAARQSFGNYEDYLRSLEMRCELGPFDTPHAERITQLINKTNQFNLTTRRYTAAEVEALMNDPACVTLYGRLLDKFGDNGIVTALIGRQTGDALDIELWIMSCRTFKRNLEYALFDRLVDVCRERGIKTINGIYLPTAKNLLVADFYATIGFEKISGGETGSVFRYTVPAERTPLNTVMETVLL